MALCSGIQRRVKTILCCNLKVSSVNVVQNHIKDDIKKIFEVCLKSKENSVTNNLFQIQTTNYIVSSSK